jgi:zinc transport system substrate-binding protein
MKYSGFKTTLLIAVVLVAPAFANHLLAADKPYNPLPVFVSIQPQAYFVKRICGDRVSVDILVMPGKNPATYAPSPGQMSQLAKAKVFFRIGVPFEDTLMPKIEKSLKDLLIVDTQKGILLRKMEGGYHDSHDMAGDQHRHIRDPHTWLSPLLVKKQAETIYKAMVHLDPSGEPEYEANYSAFIKDLDLLHNKIKESLAPVKGGTIFVFHPAFGYFADAYGLKQMAVETEGKAPKGKKLSMFIKKAKKEGVRVVFVQQQFDRSAARSIANAINGAVVPLNPLAMDYIKSLEEMADKVAEALKR